MATDSKTEKPPAPKPTAAPKPKQEFIEIAVYQIDDPPLMMHPDITDRDLEAMAKSIGMQGQLHNITVRPAGDHYQLIIGHVRLLAARKYNIPKLWARVVNADDKQAIGMILAENLERSEHNPMSEIQAILTAQKELKMTARQMHDSYGWSEAWIRDRLSILDLPSDLLPYVANRTLKLGVALLLKKLPTPQEQVKFGIDLARPEVTVEYGNRLIATYLDYIARVKRPPTEQELARMREEPEIACDWGKHRVKSSHIRVLQLCDVCLEEINFLKVKDRREREREPRALPIIGLAGQVDGTPRQEASNQ